MNNNDFNLQCPVPIGSYSTVTMAHGGGGRLTNSLIDEVFRESFGCEESAEKHDGALLSPFAAGGAKIAFTTDSFVVHPLFFPGGDIGELAVYGTVNDLAMCGARPKWLSCGFILEEGLSIETLRKIVQSMASAAKRAGARIVTGDTKVVDRGKGDGVYINTAGIGIVEHGLNLVPSSVAEGDAIIVSGDLGRHGMAVMAVREGLEFESAIESDCAPLWEPVSALLDAGIEIHCLRDLTRGGLASALCEIAEQTGSEIKLNAATIPIRDDVRGACEILGFDPLYVANEGRFAAFVAPRDAEKALSILANVENCENAAKIGRVGAAKNGLVTLLNEIGIERIVDMLSGEQLPRIC
jgi:hydrogenase expression/formation protein HypE